MLLGNVGGLFGFLVTIASSLLNILNFQKADNLLVSDLYQTEEAASSTDLIHKTELDPYKQSSCKQYFLSLLPKKCFSLGCLQRNKQEKYFERSRDAFN